MPEKKAEIKDEGNGECLVCEYDDTGFKESPGFPDMVEMSKLNDAELCRNIQCAFDHKPAPVSFIWCGATLVAINTMMHIPMYYPGKPLSHVYSDATMERYRDMSSRQAVEPHSYALASDCYRALFTPAKGATTCENQAILITGESGAGKTFNTKKILDFVAFLSCGESPPPGEMKITDKMLATTPILEGWGNGNMPRNPDSSRFGKLYKIFFSTKTRQISGCSIDLYMLEKSRLSSQQMNERNFHILYRMLADPIEATKDQIDKVKKKLSKNEPPEMIIWNKSLDGSRVDASVDGAEGMLGFDPVLKEALGLNRANWGGTGTLKDYEYFNYLNGGSTMLELHPLDRNAPGGYDRIYEDIPQGWKAADRVESCCEQGSRDFEDQMHASCTIWALEQFFDKETIQTIFEVTAATLWMGNIEFEGDSEKAVINEGDPKTSIALDHCSRLLKVDRAALIKGMSTEIISLGGGKTKEAPVKGIKKARVFRDSMARHLYDNMFIWLIGTCSDTLLTSTSGDNKHDPNRDMYIGVLDIFGFEFYENQKLRYLPAGCMSMTELEWRVGCDTVSTLMCCVSGLLAVKW
jgi:myosin heavy subunit